MELAQSAQQCRREARHLPEATRARWASQLRAAMVAHQQLRMQSHWLPQGKRLPQCKIVHAYDATMAPICKGKSHCPTPLGRKPGMISGPAEGFVFAVQLPVGNPIDARSVVPLVDKVEPASTRVPSHPKRAIHAVAGDMGGNDPKVHHILHERAMLTLGMAKTVEPIHPEPTPEEVLAILKEAGLNRIRTPHQGKLACACGYSRPVGESPMASLLSRGAGQRRYKGPHGAVIQLGMTVMAHNGATLVRIRQQRLSKRAQKFRRLLGLRRYNVKQIND